MERKKRNTYISLSQKRKLIQLATENPRLISFKVSQDFTYADAQCLWQEIARTCNALPGARKSWRQWKKTWQDIRSKSKKRAEDTNKLPSITHILTTKEKEALGLKDIQGNSELPEKTEFVPLQHSEENNISDSINESDFCEYLSEPEIEEEPPIDSKVFKKTPKMSKQKQSKNGSKHANCYFNCNIMAEQEQRKIEIKEDYYNFRKEYLQQKLNLLKEQTEALKTIAKELSDK